ncbi:MAG: hypothetical protein ACUZ8N_08225 [Candidatus Scalindua sp.]
MFNNMRDMNPSQYLNIWLDRIIKVKCIYGYFRLPFGKLCDVRMHRKQVNGGG